MIRWIGWMCLNILQRMFNKGGYGMYSMLIMLILVVVAGWLDSRLDWKEENNKEKLS